MLKDIPSKPVIFKLPGAPGPVGRQVYKLGMAGRRVWRNSNSKDIYGKGLKAGRVYFCGLIGFLEINMAIIVFASLI